MSTFLKNVLFVSALVLLTACGTGDSQTGGQVEEDQHISEEEENEMFLNWDYTLGIEQSETEALIHLSLKNTGNETRVVGFSSGQQYEIIIHDQEQHEVYRYSEGKMFTMALTEDSFEPDFEQTWTEMVDVSSFERGDYTVEATLMLYSVDGEEVTSSPFTKKATFTIE